MWRHIDVQAGWRSLAYGWAPIAIDILKGYLTCPSKHWQGGQHFIRLFLETALCSRLLRHAGDTAKKGKEGNKNLQQGYVRLLFYAVSATMAI